MSDLRGPTYLYIDSNDYLYIADSDNHRIQRWRIGATSGETIAGVTSKTRNRVLPMKVNTSKFLIQIQLDLL